MKILKSCYFRDGERLLGVGGTRTKQVTDIKVHTLPSFERKRPILTPFLIDDEYAKIAASTVTTVKSTKVGFCQISLF